MGRPGNAQLGKAQPSARGPSRPAAQVSTASPARGTARRPRSDRRLDPVRRRRPSPGTLLRLAVATVLLAIAAVTSWSPARSCGVSASSAVASSPASAPTTAPVSSASASSGSATSGAATSGAASSAAAAGVVPPGSVGVPVRLADPTALSLVRPGNRVDLLRLDETGSTAVAAAALVLRVTGAGDPTAGGLLLALSPAEAQHAVAGPGQGFAILIRPG